VRSLRRESRTDASSSTTKTTDPLARDMRSTIPCRPGRARAADVSSECRVEKDVVALVHEGDGLGGGDLQVAVDAALVAIREELERELRRVHRAPLLDGLLFEYPLL
jgi:hypothetical protein